MVWRWVAKMIRGPGDKLKEDAQWGGKKPEGRDYIIVQGQTRSH